MTRDITDNTLNRRDSAGMPFWSALDVRNRWRLHCGLRGSAVRLGALPCLTIQAGFESFNDNIPIAGGPTPVRAHIDEVLDERRQPSRVFNRVTDLNGVPDGHRTMNARGHQSHDHALTSS
jgi:hypothetical protein